MVERFWMANTQDNGQAKVDQLCFLQDNLSPNGFNYRRIFEVMCILLQLMT
jgi:hypothetical protein